MKLTKLDAEQRGLLWIGITGVIGIGFGLYALWLPAFGAMYLTDGDTLLDPITKAIEGAFVFGVTAVIAAELVLSAAAIRMTAIGRWPGRQFLLGRYAVAIAVATFAGVAVLAALL